jgi:hypothetical protein
MKRILLSSALVLLLCDCGSSSTGGGGTTPPPGSTFTLAIDNFDAWCNVQVNGAALNSTGEYTFAPGTVVNLAATAAPGFEWGYWEGTAGTSATVLHDPNMSTTVTIPATGTVDVLACCPSATLKCPS